MRSSRPNSRSSSSSTGSSTLPIRCRASRASVLTPSSSAARSERRSVSSPARSGRSTSSAFRPSCTRLPRSRAASSLSPGRPARVSRRHSPRSSTRSTGHARAHHHDRGSDRVPPPPQAVHRQPARDRHRCTVVRRKPARRAPPGPGRPPRRRDARPRDDLDGAHRGRDRPPRLRNAAHADRFVDDRPRHRRLPAGSAAAGADHDRELAAGGRHPVTRSRRPTVPAASRRSRSCCPTTRFGTSSARRRSSRSTRDADQFVARHADDGAGARRSRAPASRRLRRGARADDPRRAARRNPRACRCRGRSRRRPITAGRPSGSGKENGTTGLRVASS